MEAPTCNITRSISEYMYYLQHSHYPDTREMARRVIGLQFGVLFFSGFGRNT